MTDQTTDSSNFTIEGRPGYVHLKLMGTLQEGDLRESTRLASEKASELGVGVLDDIRDIDLRSVTIRFQSEAIGQLWKHRAVKKVAILYKGDQIGNTVRSTLELIHFIVRCKVFNDETEAVKWLQEP